jgi:two-component system sensor histidine kinase PilS (NtrC family)
MMEGGGTSGQEAYNRLKWLTFFRLVVTVLLLSAATALQLGKDPSFLTQPLLAVYSLTAGIFFLSALYAWFLKYSDRYSFQAHLQIILDTFIVSLIIFFTGGFSSIFSSLYLVVVIYAGMFLSRGWSFFTAVLCGFQYAAIIALEYFGVARPLLADGVELAVNAPGLQVVFKILMILMGCLMVAFLGNLLAEQNRKTRRELAAMEAHVKRVEKMAAVGEMAAGLAHEIKNPLASLSGSIQMLQEDMAPADAHGKLMEIVLRETDRLSSLLSDFLMFAKPPAGAPKVIDLEKALSEIISLFEKDAKCRHAISIGKEVQHDIWIEMDPAHLRQVFWNLLANAAEAIEGDGTITVSATTDRRGQVLLKVRDSGCGIPDEKVKLIFDPFFTTKARGTGLGLSIVHSILESYGNRLDVESRVGAGTTFVVHLKRVERSE